MNKIKFLLLTILVLSCAASKNSYRIYLQNEKYELTDFEKKIEKSLPEVLKNNVSFFYFGDSSNVVKLYVDGKEIPETEDVNPTNKKIFYFSTSKPKEKFLAIVNGKRYEIPVECFDNYKNAYLVKWNIYLTKGAVFDVNKFYYGKNILMK